MKITNFKTSFFFVGILFLTINSVAQSESENQDNLIVYGENFTFSVKEPPNWKGDIDRAAEFYSNIIFYQNEELIEKGGALIQTLVFKKQDENTIEDLKYDISSYEKDYPNLKQEEMIVNHKEYKCFSKLVYVENSFYQYITYINPGDSFKYGLSVAMNISKRRALDNEIEAYKLIIESLWIIK